MVGYEYQSLVPIFIECISYVFKCIISGIIQQVGIRSTGVHETNLLIGKFFLNEFVPIPEKKLHTVDINFVKYELKVLTSAIIKNFNSQHPDLNNWHSEPLPWFKQDRIIICKDVYGVC